MSKQQSDGPENSNDLSANHTPCGFGTPWWLPILLGAMAGGLGWGIRGQYGHETGAMIAGLLVSLVIAFLFCQDIGAWSTARAVAWGTVAIGFGGSMTYGQTVGLTHDAALIGNWAALRWGMLGLAIKGGIWIGFSGVFLGMGLSGVRYRSREILLLMLAMLGFYSIGVHYLNSPFDPAHKILPAIYFSDDWHWEPGAELKPRREVWGGLLLALVGTVAYSGFIRQDRLARQLTVWGILGGAVGFPLGQSLQAFHAWNPEMFRQGVWQQLDPHMNWWNMMETTFGATMGACLAWGAWRNRQHIAALADSDLHDSIANWLLLAGHLVLLMLSEFASVRLTSAVYGLGLVMGVLPIVVANNARLASIAIALPLTLLPIAGKTTRQLAYRDPVVTLGVGWLAYFVLPMLILIIAAVWLHRRAGQGMTGREFARRAMPLATWIFFGLNFAFFRFPWPWDSWTSRTPNAILFAICAAGLTIASFTFARKSSTAER